MKVVEKFVSINGEGTRAGELAVFIRFKGCNLHCGYCDTKWANDSACPYEELTPEEIYRYVKSTGVKNITLTGGEPLLQADIPQLLNLLLSDASLRVEIETNGSIRLRDFCKERRPVFTMDYKLPSSGCEKEMVLDNFADLQKDDAVKFVSGSKEDLDRACELIARFGLAQKCHVYFSPVFGAMEPEEIVKTMVTHKMNDVRIQIQMHKVIWDSDRRGV